MAAYFKFLLFNILPSYIYKYNECILLNLYANKRKYNTKCSYEPVRNFKNFVYKKILMLLKNSATNELFKLSP